MNSLRESAHNKEKGFSFAEALIVIALGITLAVFTVPIGFRFFELQQLDETRRGISTALRTAQAQSSAQKNDAMFGVKILSDSFVLFQGASYASRAALEDEAFPIGRNISVAGDTEFAFSKLWGTTTAGTITLALGTESRSISVNSEGLTE